MIRKGVLAGGISLLLLLLVQGQALSQEEMSREEREAQAFEAMFPEGVPSEKDVYRTDRLLLSATGSLKPAYLAPSVTTVISAEEIERMGAITLDEVLETVPGLHVEPSSSTFFSSVWSMRGLHSTLNPHVLLLINSVPYTYTYTGSRPLKYQMPVTMISRVEVVRGPSSALYGADAFSGVINVITKDNHEIDGTRVGGRVGSFDSYDAWLQHGQDYSDWEISIGLEWQKTRGDKERIIASDYVTSVAPAFSEAPGAMPDWNELLDSNITIRHGNWEGHLYSNLQKSDSGLGSLQALAEGGERKNSGLLLDLNYTNREWFSEWKLGARLYYSYQKSDNLVQLLPSSFLDMVGNPIAENQDGGLELSGIYTGWIRHTLRIGVGGKNYDFEPDQYKNFGPVAGANQFGPLVHVTDSDYLYISPANKQLVYGLLQDEYRLFKGWQLTAGIRYDNYSDFGPTTNPRVALVWETLPELTTKLLYGQAFRAPSFSEQWVKNNPQVVGNPDLGPEEIETLELAFDYQPTTALRLGLNFFLYEATGMIEATGPLPQPYENVGEQEGRGFEVEVEWQIAADFDLKANFAYQRAKLKASDSLVPDAPGMQFYLNPHWIFHPDWSLDLQYFWVGDRPRAQNDPRAEIDDYSMINMTLRKKNIFKQMDLALGVRNLFDEDGRIPSPYSPGAPGGAYVVNDYPMEGRSYWLELRYRF